MLVEMIKCKNTTVMLVLSVVVAACGGGGGGGGSTATVSSGDLVMTTDIASDSDVVLGGSHKYEVSLVGSENLSEPVVVHVTSSNSNVASIIENTCATADLHLDGTSKSCSFYVKGVGAGSATVSVTSNDYSSITYQLNVSQQWGKFSGKVIDNYGSEINIQQISFGGNNLYVRSASWVYKSTGSSWQMVGGGDAVDEFTPNVEIVSDDNHVCVSAGYIDSGRAWTKVKCSTNDSVWHELPTIESWSSSSSSLYKGKLYALSMDNHANYAVMSCPVDDCILWHQEGYIFTDFNGGANTIMFESNGFLKNDIGVYYKDESGSWQIQGLDSSENYGNYLAAGDSGVAFIPVIGDVNMPYFLQPAYYNSNNNIGGTFTQVSNSILVEGMVSTNSIVMDSDKLFISPGDGSIYLSTNTDESWSGWSRVGNNNPVLGAVYVHDNKVYSYNMSNTEHDSQVYVYTLD